MAQFIAQSNETIRRKNKFSASVA